MEFKRLLNMYRLSIFWINIIYLLVAYSATTTANFPYDLMAESSDAVVTKAADKTKGDDEKRTLSQQVAEGKYALIHKEIFNKPVQRPGVLSYSSNNEVPNDTSSNFGGLNKSDIWLAENHLLVIKGGIYPLLETLPEYSDPVWPPIDDYNAPRRQVKIPKHPKVPPPFPVQLSDGGPLQILGTNFTRNINDTFFPPQYPVPPLEGYEPGSGPFYPPQYPYPPNTPPGKAPFPGPPDPPTIQGGNNKASAVIITGSILPPFFDSLPPGSAILPPPNITDQNDEDDLSIYYPPPYSFYYPTDNTTQVPPGPLVPGIVLPPPPDFFGVLQSPTTTPKIPTTTKSPQQTKPGSVTILRPIKPKPPGVYVYDNHIPHRPFVEYGPPKHNKISINTTKIPLRAYFTTSSKTEYIKPTKPKKEFYYYDVNVPETNSISSQIPPKTRLANNSNNYVVKPQLYYLPTPTNNFKAHIVQLEEQLRTYKNPPNQFTQNAHTKPSSKPVYQYSFEVSNYQEQRNKLQGNTGPKYSVQIESAIEITTPTPTYYRPQYNYQTQRTITTNSNNHGYVTTNSPLYNAHYTKQDGKLFDDITKTYFTTFGRRIKASTPLPSVQQYSITKPITNIETLKSVNIQNQHYKTRPNIETFINENIPGTIQAIRVPNQRPIQNNNNYPHIQEINEGNQQFIRTKPINSYSQVPEVQTIQAFDISPNEQYIPIQQQKLNPYLHVIKPEAVAIPTRQNIIFNPYVHGRKQQPDIQTIQAISIEQENKAGSFISYQLPGDDGAHFYFLTPQLAQNADTQHINYYYPQPRSSRLRRDS